MRSAITLSILLPYALALPLHTRQIVSDTTPYTNALTTISDGTHSLNSAIQNISTSNISDLLPIDTQARQLNTELQNQTASIRSAQPLAYLSALPVAVQAGGLITDTQSTLQNLVNKRQYVFNANAQGVVVADLQMLKASSDAFVDALKAQTPSVFGFVADSDKQQLDAAFDQAIAAFQDSASGSGGSSGGSAGGSAGGASPESPAASPAASPAGSASSSSVDGFDGSSRRQLWTEGGNAGGYSDDAGSYGDNAGSYGDNTGHYGDSAGSYDDNEGSYGDNEGRYYGGGRGRSSSGSRSSSGADGLSRNRYRPSGCREGHSDAVQATGGQRRTRRAGGKVKRGDELGVIGKEARLK